MIPLNYRGYDLCSLIIDGNVIYSEKKQIETRKRKLTAHIIDVDNSISTYDKEQDKLIQQLEFKLRENKMQLEQEKDAETRRTKQTLAEQLQKQKELEKLLQKQQKELENMKKERQKRKETNVIYTQPKFEVNAKQQTIIPKVKKTPKAHNKKIDEHFPFVDEISKLGGINEENSSVSSNERDEDYFNSFLKQNINRKSMSPNRRRSSISITEIIAPLIEKPRISSRGSQLDEYEKKLNTKSHRRQSKLVNKYYDPYEDEDNEESAIKKEIIKNPFIHYASDEKIDERNINGILKTFGIDTETINRNKENILRRQSRLNEIDITYDNTPYLNKKIPPNRKILKPKLINLNFTPGTVLIL